MAPAVPSQHGYTLAECLRLAQQSYPKVAEARARVARVREQLTEARYAPFMDFEGKVGVTWAPQFNGTNLYSPDSDRTISNDNRFAWRANVSGTVPLWTFGKIESVQKSAEAQVELKEAEVRKAQNELALAVREAYFGLQFASSAGALVRDAISQLRSRQEKLLAAVEEGDADEAAYFRLQLQLEELVAKESQARRQGQVAAVGLAFLSGVRGPIQIAEGELKAVRHALLPLSKYIESARALRPELRMAEFGMKARRAQVEQAEAALFPDVGLVLNAGYGFAPGIVDQRNPFANDQANFVSAGAGIGVRWKLDVLPGVARLGQARAQLAETRATSRYAEAGVEVEVEKAYREAQDAQRQVEAYTRAVRVARRWLISVQQGVEIGVMEEEGLAEPAKEYALRRFSQLSAVHDYNVAISRLWLASGRSTDFELDGLVSQGQQR